MSNSKAVSNATHHSRAAGDPYYIGDPYDSFPAPVSKQWKTDTSKLPYLRYIQSLAPGWPHLKYLADFMEVSTTPLKWKSFHFNDSARQERLERTKVTLISWKGDEDTQSAAFTTSHDLKTHLEATLVNRPDSTTTKLYIVEDLSRAVIELLGSTFDVEPEFFREHVNDYAWYNIRDPWMEPPNLRASIVQQRWRQVRWMRARYFRDRASFRKAEAETSQFNVVRRLNEDHNHWAFLDQEDAIVALLRTRASLWVGDRGQSGEGTVGILLLDPTPKVGFPLWFGYRNWKRPPLLSEHGSAVGPPRTSLFDDFVYWAQCEKPHYECAHSSSQVFLRPLLRLACAEWLVLCEYTKTRLGQINWELSFPEKFGSTDDFIDKALRRLHTWRRMVPIFHEMLVDIFDSLPEQGEDLNSTATTGVNSPTNPNQPCASCGSSLSASDLRFPQSLLPDYRRVVARVDKLQAQVDRLAALVVATITTQDSRIALSENQSLARLTWLATIFIPLSFISSLFSMQVDISQLRMTFAWYFAAAIPVTCIALLLARKLKLKRIHVHAGNEAKLDDFRVS